MNNLSWSIWGTPLDKISAEIANEITDIPIILCLGNDKLLQDCLGPMIGSILVSQHYPSYVYGTLDAPICTENLLFAYKFIKATHPTKKLLIIDASSTTQVDRIGKIVLAKDYKPFNPILQNIQLKADWFLFGVCSSHQQLFPKMENTRLAITKKLADAISSILLHNAQDISKNKTSFSYY